MQQTLHAAEVNSLPEQNVLPQVEASVVGRNCRIGRGAHITGCYLLDNVSVGDQAQVSHSLLCDGVSVGAHAMIFPGSVLSFKVSTGIASQQLGGACCNQKIVVGRILTANRKDPTQGNPGEPAMVQSSCQSCVPI